MPDRLSVQKTYKLYLGGAFPRSESGRAMKVEDPKGRVLAHVAHASRKDFRDAVEAAAKAQPGWASRTAYNRGQVLYRMAEMAEGKRDELAAAIIGPTGRAKREAVREVDASIDRLVCFAGWADKFAQVLGCQNPVAGPHYNFTLPEASGVAVLFPPDEPALLGLVSMIAPAICAGCAVIAIVNDFNPLPAAVLGEVCATSDLPAGVVNILTTARAELVAHAADHREVIAIAGVNLPAEDAKRLQLGAAENVKRVTISEFTDDEWYGSAPDSPWMIESFLEYKTIWHPSAT